MKCDWCFGMQIILALMLFAVAACADAQPKSLQREAFEIGGMLGAYYACNGYHADELHERYLQLVKEQQPLKVDLALVHLDRGILVGFMNPGDCEVMQRAYVDIWEVMLDD